MRLERIDANYAPFQSGGPERRRANTVKYAVLSVVSTTRGRRNQRQSEPDRPKRAQVHRNGASGAPEPLPSLRPFLDRGGADSARHYRLAFDLAPIRLRRDVTPSATSADTHSA